MCKYHVLSTYVAIISRAAMRGRKGRVEHLQASKSPTSTVVHDCFLGACARRMPVNRHDRESAELDTSPLENLLSDATFPVPTNLPTGPAACQRSRTSAAESGEGQATRIQSGSDQLNAPELSFLAGWWSKALTKLESSKAPNCLNVAAAAQPPGLHQRVLRLQQRKPDPKKQPLYDLEAINLQLVQLLETADSNCLELPKYTGKAQKKQVGDMYSV